MNIFRCKMCGGNLNVVDLKGIVECEYCGCKQTIHNTNDEKKNYLYNKANNLRWKNEFDKAMSTYELILMDFPNEAEAYWGIVLCRYGIEYVDDQKTNKKIPTCHRTQFKSIFDDEDYINAIEKADVISKEFYQTQAEEIDKLQKQILSITQKEEPYDIFICYKELDNDGNRTRDSVYAQDIYNTLIDNGYKVFFSRVTLENKLGINYEPYIFAALNSAKIMLVIGTKPEYFNSVWVRNEWSRFISIMNESKNKYIIPCYRDIDVYELPDELLGFQGLDMSKIGFIQDLIRNVNKLMNREHNNTKEASREIIHNGVNVEAMLRRAEILIEDEEFVKASSLLEQVLNNSPENARAYFLLLLIDLGFTNEEQIKTSISILEKSKYYNKALKFADDELRKELEEYNRNSIHNFNNYFADFKNKGLHYEAIDQLRKLHKSPETFNHIEENLLCLLRNRNNQDKEKLIIYSDEFIKDYSDNSKPYVIRLLVDLDLTEEEDLEKSKILFENNQYYQLAIKYADPIYKEKLKNYHNKCIDNLYIEGKYFIENGDYLKAIDNFFIIKSHKDVFNDIEISYRGLLRTRKCDYNTRNIYMEQLISSFPKNSTSYILWLMEKLNCMTEEELTKKGIILENEYYYREIYERADYETRNILRKYNSESIDYCYELAILKLKNKDYQGAKKLFESISKHIEVSSYFKKIARIENRINVFNKFKRIISLYLIFVIYCGLFAYIYYLKVDDRELTIWPLIILLYFGIALFLIPMMYDGVKDDRKKRIISNIVSIVTCLIAIFIKNNIIDTIAFLVSTIFTFIIRTYYLKPLFYIKF